MSRARALAVLAVLLLALLAAGGWMLLRKGYSARRPPSAIEAAIARRLRHLATPPGAREARNPVPSTDAILAEAKHHYADHCATCHGSDGSGDTPMGRGLYPPPPDLRGQDTQSLTDGELYAIIVNGIRFTGMPGWGDESADDKEATWGLVHLIRRMPAMAPGELVPERSQVATSTHEEPGAATHDEEADRRRIEDDFLAGGDAYLAP